MNTNLKSIIAGKAAVAVALTAAISAAAPGVASAQTGRNIVNCDAPGGRQQAGAVLGAIVGGVVGNNLAKNERALGTVAGAGLGAAAGSYVGCKQQRDRANAYGTAYNAGYAQAAANTYVARSNLKVRAAPTTASAQVGSLGRGQAFEALGGGNGWVQVGQNGRPVGYVASAYVDPIRY